jgi:catechol 2,3-dioxygenase-like lactoylglutathione lyase family enzyme
MTTTVPSATEEPTPQWQGVNHLALVTTDMDATVRFYHGTLGGRLVATLGTEAFRHYFFEFGPHCTVAFFEYAGSTVEPFVKAAGVPDPRAPQFDHLALNLPDEEALHDLRRRLKAADCEVTDIIDHGGVRSVYFTDPNGIASKPPGGSTTPRAAPPTTPTIASSAIPTPSPPSESSKRRARSRAPQAPNALDRSRDSRSSPVQSVRSRRVQRHPRRSDQPSRTSEAPITPGEVAR